MYIFRLEGQPQNQENVTLHNKLKYIYVEDVVYVVG